MQEPTLLEWLQQIDTHLINIFPAVRVKHIVSIEIEILPRIQRHENGPSTCVDSVLDVARVE